MTSGHRVSRRKVEPAKVEEATSQPAEELEAKAEEVEEAAVSEPVVEPVVVEKAPVRVLVSSIAPGSKFIYNGQLFRRVPAAHGRIVGQRLVNHPQGATLIPKGTLPFDPNTQVEPV